jgi:hypothetical protein
VGNEISPNLITKLTFCTHRPPEEGESPDLDNDTVTPRAKKSPSLLTRELQGEGVGVRDVDERKEINVHHSEKEEDSD